MSDPPELKLQVFFANSGWQTARAAATLITRCNSWLPSADEKLVFVSIFYPQDSYPGKFHGIRFPALHSAVSELLVPARFWGLMVTELQNNTVETKADRVNLRH